MKELYSRRKLPHIYPVGAIFFITFRLNDSIPQSKLKFLSEDWVRMKNEVKETNFIKRQSLISRLRREQFGRFDHQLDMSPYGDCVFRNEEIAQILFDKIISFNSKYYILLCLSIMPNHVHMLVDTSVQVPIGYDLNSIPESYVNVNHWMRLIKGSSSYLINKRLNRVGQLWAHESYDQYVRSSRDLNNYYNYILDNPVRAKLPAKYLQKPYLFREESLL